MKTIMALAFAVLSFNVSAQTETPEFYSPEFTVAKISPMCPRSIPSGAMCGGYGSIVTVSATLGCLDSLEFFSTKTVAHDLKVELHIVSVAFRNPESARVRCNRANTVTKVVPVPQMGQVTVINTVIQN